MNELPPEVLQFPKLKATHSPQAIQVLVSILLAMERIVSQKSDFAAERSVIGKVEYSYPKGPGGPRSCSFNSIGFSYFNGGFDRKTDSSPWYKSDLLIAERQDPHPINVTPAFYEHALGLIFEKNLRRDPLLEYSNPSVNKFYFHSKNNPSIQYIFTAFLGGSDLKEHFPKNFFLVEIVNAALEN